MSNATKYIRPIIKVYCIGIENCIASASNNAVTIGGPGNSGSPEIEDAIVEEKPFDITF